MSREETMKHSIPSDWKIIFCLLVLGLIFNVSTWFHPVYYPAIRTIILILLPVFLFAGLFQPHYLLWYIFLVFFTQDSFPNNVLYETYYGYEATTIYFHNFLSIFSVFDLLLVSSIYILVIKKLKERKIQNLFKGRIEYYLIYLIVFISLIHGLTLGYETKSILAEIQIWIYAGVIYFLTSQMITNPNILRQTIVYLILLLLVTVPIEFLYFTITNYHSLLAVVGRLRKPLLNGTDDTYMVFTTFVLLSWVVERRKSTRWIYQSLSIFGILVGLAVIYLNTGRMLALLTMLSLIIFIIFSGFQLRSYLLIVLIPLFIFALTLLLQPSHITKLMDNFTSLFSITQNYKKDTSAADRVIEFYNVAETLNENKSQLFGLGWGGLWKEYYYQPGRGSLAAYADKTLTTHRQTHVIFSQLFLKCGYLGTAIISFSIFSLWMHFYRYYRKKCSHEFKPIMLGLLFTYPIYFYFSPVFQIGIAFGIILAFLRKIEIFEESSLSLTVIQNY